MMQFYAIGVVALLAAISPGPDFAIVARNALTYHRRSAIVTSFGIGLGILLHSTYCILGLALIIAHSMIAFTIVKYLGAAYLIFLGTKSLLANQSKLSTNSVRVMNQHGAWQALRNGFFTNALNPKCTLFMLSIFTMVVRPHTPIYIQIIFAFEIALITTGWFVFLAYCLTYQPIKSSIAKVQLLVSKLIGLVLIALGVAVIFKMY